MQDHSSSNHLSSTFNYLSTSLKPFAFTKGKSLTPKSTISATHHPLIEMSYPNLTSFKALSFDVYGTLIDQEPGMIRGLQPIISRLPTESEYKQNPSLLIRRFDEFVQDIEAAEPTLRHDIILLRAFNDLTNELQVSVPEDETKHVGSIPGTWLPFPDTIPGLQILKKHYKLITLTNMDNANVSKTLKHLEPVEFDKVCTAEDIGSYKPAQKNFEYLFENVKKDLHVSKDQGELLHVARSLTADHVPAKRFDLRSVWISRGGNTKEGQGVGGDYERLKQDVAFEWRFETIGEFAKEVERQFREKSA
jgi:2-haloalkanoic acid dehalogenase type II